MEPGRVLERPTEQATEAWSISVLKSITQERVLILRENLLVFGIKTICLRHQSDNFQTQLV